MTPIEGVDYAWNGPSATALAAAGKRFAVRYGGPGSAGKQLTAQELHDLTAQGIEVVSNAEGIAGGFLGRTAGRAWASQARQHFRNLGMPEDRPIYYSVDWDAQASDWPDIDAALAGAAEVDGASNVGVYGGYRTIAHCSSARTARWFWQTYAWSGQPTRWHPANHLEQYRNGVTIGGSDLDLTRAVKADFGQWGTGMTKQDILDALNEWAASSSQADGTPDSILGKRVLNQGAPNGLRPVDPANPLHHQRTPEWQVLEDIGIALADLRKRPAVDVIALAAALVAALPPVTSGITPEQVEDAVRAVMNNAQY